MSIEQNKAIARRFFEVWNANTPEELDTFLSADYVTHSPLPGVSSDREGMKQWMSMVSTAFPGIQFSVDIQIAEGNMVMTRWSAKGMHTASFMGIPATNKMGHVTGNVLVRIVDGQTVESWGEWDAMGLMRQLGVVPSPV